MSTLSYALNILHTAAGLSSRRLGWCPALGALLAVVTGLVLDVPVAHGQQRRDWMVDAQPAGTTLSVDAVFLGVQATLDHRIPIYDNKMNQLTLRANSLFTVPFYESQADVDLRMLVLTLGGSVGVHNTFRLMEFGAGDRMDRWQRVQRDLRGDSRSQFWTYAVARVGLDLPFNEHVLLHNVNTWRFEGRPDGSFDWFNGVIHDGSIIRSDTQLFFKHRDWGGIGPMFQVLNFDYGGQRFTQFNYGMMLTTRPGGTARDDIFFLQVLVHPGSTLGGIDNSDVYGMHLFFAPVTAVLAYRVVLTL